MERNDTFTDFNYRFCISKKMGFGVCVFCIEGLLMGQSMMFHLCHIIYAQSVPRFSGHAPDVAFSVLTVAVLSESDAWAVPLSGPDSPLTRAFPTGSKFYSFL